MKRKMESVSESKDSLSDSDDSDIDEFLDWRTKKAIKWMIFCYIEVDRLSS